MRTISTFLVVVMALAWAGCGNESALSKSDAANEDSTGNDDAAGDDVVPEEETGEEETPPVNEEESACTVTHFTSGGESRFRVQGPPSDGESAYDCVKCPGPADVVRLTYTGNGFTQSLEFDGSLTNGSGAASDELILEQSGNVCWSEDYDAGGDLPSASALTVDGHAATIEFDQGPDAAGSSGTLSYYRNGVLRFAIPVVEGGELAAYPDDGVQLK